VIPTGYKSKIPKTHSYPLGAKAISDALAGAPQFDLLELWFSSGWKRFGRDRILVAPKEVLTLQYSGPGGPLAGWKIYIRPVPSVRKHEVKSKLIAEALPRIRRWLESNLHSLDREGGHRLTFFFDELTGELTAEEYSSSDWNTERM
jgi:hypothetical protein